MNVYDYPMDHLTRTFQQVASLSVKTSTGMTFQDFVTLAADDIEPVRSPLQQQLYDLLKEANHPLTNAALERIEELEREVQVLDKKLATRDPREINRLKLENKRLQQQLHLRSKGR